MPRRIRPLLLAASLLLLSVPAADAASVVYVDGGSVWISSLDGAQKTAIAAPVVDVNGKTEPWLDVAQSDNGRIVAVRNEPGKISRLSTYRIWEPDGTSTVQGPLSAPAGWQLYAYPLGLDITSDGKHLVYGFSNSSCCPYSLAEGTYVRVADGNVLDPITISGRFYPSLVGKRMVAASGTTVSVQDQDSGEPYGTAFTPWLDTAGVGMDLRRTDVSADGKLAAFEVEQWTGTTLTTGKIGVVATQGIDQPVSFPAAVDCFLPASGVAKEVSMAPDGTRIAWTDDQGLKVAGTPSTAADPCVLSAPPVVISSTGRHASIGGAGVSAFLPAAPPPPSPPPPTTTQPATTTPGGTTAPPGGGTASPTPTGAAPGVTLPARVTAKALAASRGLAVRVRVRAAGRVKVVATVPASRLRRRGRPVVVASTVVTARRAGTLTVRLRVKAALRSKVRRLRGTILTLRVTQAGRTTTRKVRLG